MRMSSQSNSSVYSEKKIAAYEAMFKESSFAKPQEVYLTITVAHLFGQAYIMEQQGTKEGDPVYSRFVCPLEEITKVYINENAKSSPLFIQCDTDVKGVVHRKRIIVPCLDNVASIVSQIKEVQAAHMEKVNAALEREKQRKLREIEEKRKEEQAAIKAVNIPTPAPVPTPAPEKADKKNVEDLNNEIAESMKALESFEKVISSTPAKEAAPKKPALDLDSIPDKAEAVPAPAPAPVPAAEPAPVKEEVPIQEVKPVQATVQPEPAAPVEEKPIQPAVTAAPRVNPNGKPSALSDFETEVRKLKALKDEGKITAEEYAAQKKKLVSELY